jgi:hypothetical protein
LGLSEFLVCNGKVCFKVGPCFVGCSASSPVAAYIGKKAGLEDSIIGIGDDLGWSVGSISGGSKINGVFILVKEWLDGLRGIVGFLHVLAVLDEVGGVDVSICCV